MQVSMSWLSDWVDIGTNAMTLGSDLTLAGLEVSSIKAHASLHGKIVVGEIVGCRPHPLRQNLTICNVSVGRGRPVDIVCGAKNARVGLKAPTALSGAVLPNGELVSRRNIYDHPSAGMLCSSSEIGIDEVSVGIVELDKSAKVGSRMLEHLDLSDTIIDVELTPNRGDCLSILGIAREVAAIRGVKIREQKLKSRKSSISTRIPIMVEAVQDSPRYLGRVVEGLDPHSMTPDWMKERLRRSGLRSLSPIVDITNYVMLELGQPLHAFDFNSVSERIVVRHSHPGETLVLLDGAEVKLSPGTLVIANDKVPIGLAGIMGGQQSGVTRQTESIFLEAAYFRPEIIGTRAREYGLQTDASYRFERGVDPRQQRRAVLRASELLLDICGGQLGPISEVVSSKCLPKKRIIVLNQKRLNDILGTPIHAAQIRKILSNLDLRPKRLGHGWRVQAPSYRFDIEGEHDLIEEVARLFGFWNIPNEPPKVVAQPSLMSEKDMLLDGFENYLVNLDFNEVITYSFVDGKIQDRLDPKRNSIKLRNPIASNMNVMRSSLWTGLLQSVDVNYRRQIRRIRLFEAGHIFYREKGQVVERSRIGAVACGSRYRTHWNQEESADIDFFDMKGVLEGLLGLDGRGRTYRYLPTKHPALHPGQSAEIRFGRRSVGLIGLLHPGIQSFLGLEVPIYLFEVDFSVISERNIPSYEAVSRFPSVTRDLSIVVRAETPAVEVERLIAGLAGELLTSVSLFDVYSGKGIKKFHKSLSFSLTLQSSSRNLTDKEVETVFSKIVTALEKKGGRLRSVIN